MSEINQLLVYQATKVAKSPELWGNSSMPGDGRFESYEQ